LNGCHPDRGRVTPGETEPPHQKSSFAAIDSGVIRIPTGIVHTESEAVRCDEKESRSGILPVEVRVFTPGSIRSWREARPIPFRLALIPGEG